MSHLSGCFKILSLFKQISLGLLIFKRSPSFLFCIKGQDLVKANTLLTHRYIIIYVDTCLLVLGDVGVLGDVYKEILVHVFES